MAPPSKKKISLEIKFCNYVNENLLTLKSVYYQSLETFQW